MWGWAPGPRCRLPEPGTASPAPPSRAFVPCPDCTLTDTETLCRKTCGHWKSFTPVSGEISKARFQPSPF